MHYLIYTTIRSSDAAKAFNKLRLVNRSENKPDRVWLIAATTTAKRTPVKRFASPAAVRAAYDSRLRCLKFSDSGQRVLARRVS